MLINVRVSELVSHTSNSIPLAFIFSIIIYNSLSLIYAPGQGTIEAELGPHSSIDMSSTYKWDGALVSGSEISSIGNVMYSSHSIWLISMGIILLLAMVGAIAISLGPVQKTNDLTQGLSR
jgi:NADH:ubiquinone oxidoreductase subunit 6 (subunit J)